MQLKALTKSCNETLNLCLTLKDEGLSIQWCVYAPTVLTIKCNVDRKYKVHKDIWPAV